MKPLIRLTLLAIALCAQPVLAQQHIPSFATNGQEVTFDAELVSINPAPEFVVSGWPLDDRLNLFGTQSAPIKLILEYDVTYTVAMQGRPEDPLNPNRAVVNDTITITQTDAQRIRFLWLMKGKADLFFEANRFDFPTISKALDEPLE